MVKITGSQRIDLLGIKKADLPKVGGSRHAVRPECTKGVRMVNPASARTSAASARDSTSAGIEVTPLRKSLYAAQSEDGRRRLSRNCAEATVKDIGLIGVEGGWQVVVGGGGEVGRKADLLTTVETTMGARGLGAVLPVPRARELPRTHLRLRRHGD